VLTKRDPEGGHIEDHVKRIARAERSATLVAAAEKLLANPQVQYHLGMAYAQAGGKDMARKALTAALSAPADFAGKDDARKTLAALK
jgi:hypothetical protein